MSSAKKRAKKDLENQDEEDKHSEELALDEEFMEEDNFDSPDRGGENGDGVRQNLGKRLRQENGLVELTKKFIQLIKDAPEQCVDLNDAVDKLAV
jgi:hypothetical protein